MRWIILHIVSLIIGTSLSAQLDFGIGEWKSHLPQQLGRKVTQSPNKIIYANRWNLILIDKEDLSVDFLTKVDGLSDMGIGEIQYDQFNDQLIVAYSNSNIDIIREDHIVNIPNIKSNTNIPGDKTIYNIYVYNSERLFFSTGFGIVEFNPKRGNFGSTTFTGLRVNWMQSHKGFLYAATEEGLYRVPLDENINLGDFDQWDFLSLSRGLPPLYNARSVESFGDHIYVSEGPNMYRSRDGVQFELFFSNPDASYDAVFLNAKNDKLIAGFRDDGTGSRVLFFDDSGDFTEGGGRCFDRVTYSTLDNTNRVWYADDFDEIRYANNLESDCERLSYNSPFSHLVSDIAIRDDILVAASGGVSESFLYLFSRFGFYIKQSGSWTNINESKNANFRELDALSIFRVAIHPTFNTIYAGSYWAGLVEYDLDNGDLFVFNKTNSTLRGAIGDEARERITGLDFDDGENLWVSTYGAPKPLNVLTADGEWISYDVISGKTLSNVEVDEDNYKWTTVFGNAGGILVFDTGESLQSTADDRQRFINSSNSEITSNLVNCVEVDNEGVIWVGTSEGPVIFDCGSDVFDSDCRGVRRKVLQDSIAAFLLADQDIRAIETDGANRKWFGTRNGIFVQSPDGTEQIHQFTVDNSPLFDNQIQGLSFEPKSGIMYIGTNRGIISYRTASSGPSVFHRKSEVYVFPNPVRPDYHGPITVKGLVAEALVQITDINGQLIYETESLGGQAIWDRTNLNGELVPSGVYLIFSSEKRAFDTPGSFVTKVMVISD